MLICAIEVLNITIIIIIINIIINTVLQIIIINITNPMTLLEGYYFKLLLRRSKILTYIPLVTESSATPHPVAPPPITNTSNSGVFFKALICTDLDGRGMFGLSSVAFPAAFTDKNGF